MKQQCSFCNGRGCYEELSQDGDGNDMWVDEQCEDCDGTGEIYDEEAESDPD